MTKFISQVFSVLGPRAQMSWMGFLTGQKNKYSLIFQKLTFPSGLKFCKINSHTFKDIVTISCIRAFLCKK